MTFRLPNSFANAILLKFYQYFAIVNTLSFVEIKLL